MANKLKHTYYLISFLILIPTVVFSQAQSADGLSINRASVEEQKNIYPIPGSHLLREKENIIQEYFKKNPNARKMSKPRDTAWDFSVGDTYNWWATNLSNNNDYEVSSTCRAKGEYCYIFVEDAAWGNRVTQTVVTSIQDAFDNSTPTDITRGIYQIDVDTFGEPPNVDSDPRIIILILDIKDGFSGSGGYVAGYFYSANEYPDGDPALGGVRSNHAEIFYMDCNPADLINDRTDALNTTAHEFQHMIHWQHDEGEMVFVNEGLSEVAAYLCGYGFRNDHLYIRNTNTNLLTWNYDNSLPDYTRAALWTLYIYEQFPTGILKDLVLNHHSQWSDIDQTFKGRDASRGFYSVFEDWLIANYANDNSLNRKYYYDYSQLSKPIPIYTHDGSSTLPTKNEHVKSLSAQYIKFVDGSNLSMTFNSTSDAIHIKAIKIGNATVVEDVPINSLYTPAGYGATYSEITFVVYNTAPTMGASYSYSAAGPEIRYDDGVPEGYLQSLSQGDSIAVQFSGVPNTNLDSVRIAFRQSGTIQMGIWKFSGLYSPSPFGDNLYQPQNIISPNSTTSTPYPEPFDNWVTIDLTEQNIDAGSDFIISFLVGSDPNIPGIMYSSEPMGGKGTVRSYKYSTGLKSNQWNYISDNIVRGNILNFLVRAYISAGNSTVALDQEITIGNTENFKLEQNFPNPFNALTTIEYNNTIESNITLAIYDLMGNEIITLVNENTSPGNHIVLWNGKNNLGQAVNSGVYLFSLQAGDFTHTRKMIYLK